MAVVDNDISKNWFSSTVSTNIGTSYISLLYHGDRVGKVEYKINMHSVNVHAQCTG